MSILETISVDPSLNDASTFDITILSGEFKDVVYRLGRVSFSDDDEEDESGGATMSFDYDIISGQDKITDKTLFEKYIGDAIVAMLKEQLARQEVVYTGGI